MLAGTNVSNQEAKAKNTAQIKIYFVIDQKINGKKEEKQPKKKRKTKRNSNKFKTLKCNDVDRSFS